VGYHIETRDGLTRLRKAREDFLASRCVPDDLPEWLSASWRRSRFYGLDVTRDHVPNAPVSVETPLARAAAPVLSRLAEDLAGLHAAVVLSDCRARIVGSWSADDTMRAHLDRIDTRPGADLSEGSTGTNAINHVLDTRGPAVIGGPQHLFELYQNTVCAGAPVREPVTGKVSGAVAVVCELDAPLRVLHALAGTATSAIERELLHAASAHEHRLLEAYLAAGPGRHAIAVLDGRTRIVSDAAADLLLPRDLETLESYAIEAARDGRLRISELTLDDRLRIHLRPATPGDSRGLLVTVEQAAGRPTRSRGRSSVLTRAGLTGSSPAWRALERAVDNAGARPILLLGEAGVGKTSVARAILGSPKVFEAPVDEHRWLADLADAVRAPGGILLRHVEQLPDPLAVQVADLLAGDHPSHVVATLTACGDRPAEELRSRWAPVEIVVPPLRDRTEDIPDLAVRFSRAHLTHDALGTLRRHDWPGNVAELKATIAWANEEASGHTVTARDLPGRLRSSPSYPRLTEMEKAERAAISEALRASDGNRVHAAARLGIGRATLYRKLRRYGLT
jgi:transcriptional regulator of acetoin/glycerol metabolism